MSWLFALGGQSYWSFSISPSDEYSGLISFRTEWFDLLANQGTLKSLLQHHSSEASILQWSAMQYCSLQHWTLLSPPDTSITGCHFLFGPDSSFLLELFILFFPVAYWTPTDLEKLIFQCHVFLLFILFMGFSRQEHWGCLPFPSPVDHV